MKHKIFVAFLILLSTFPQLSYSQEYKSRLDHADFLFSRKHFPAAFKSYKEILNSGVFSPAMLLKMALISEQSGDIVSCLYYLNLYYNFRPDRQVHLKMEELAEKYNLEGYDYTDSEYFTFLYRENYYYILLFFLTLSGLYFVHLALKKINGNPLSIRPLLFIGLLFILFYIVNFDFIMPKGIISRKNTFLMSAPASGSDLMAKIERGQRVKILGKEDIWYKIEWAGKFSYIKESDVLLIGSL
jgi:hypothetical protein